MGITTNRQLLDSRSKVIAASSSAVAVLWATYWLIEIAKGRATGPLPYIAVCYLGIIGLGFALAIRTQPLVVSTWWPFVATSAVLTWGPQANRELRSSGIATFLTAVGFVVAASAIEKRRREHVARV